MNFIKTKKGIYDIEKRAYYLFDGSVRSANYCIDYEDDPSSCVVADTMEELGFSFKKGRRGGERMTNREWINSLTDEEFASWICDGEAYNPRTNAYGQPSPKWETLKYGYTDAKGGLLIWLKKERKQ